VTPSVAIAYALVAGFLFAISRAPETATASVPPLPGKTMAATPAE
jgi:hypothetical protein